MWSHYPHARQLQMPTGLMKGHHEEEAEQKQRLLVPKGQSTDGDTELQGQRGQGRSSTRVPRQGGAEPKFGPRHPDSERLL